MAGEQMRGERQTETSAMPLLPPKRADDRRQRADRQLLADTLVRIYLDRWAAGYYWDSEARSWTERYEEAS